MVENIHQRDTSTYITDRQVIIKLTGSNIQYIKKIPKPNVLSNYFTFYTSKIRKNRDIILIPV